MKREAKDIIAMLNAHSEALGDDLIALVEDVSDSIGTEPEVDMSLYVARSDYDDLKQKYISRFESGPQPEQLKKPEPKKRITYADLFEEE